MREEDGTPPEVQSRLNGMLQFGETLTVWYEQVSRLPTATLIKLMRMGARISKFVKR